MAELNYIRLDDDVSFQLIRTNPKLTSNTKLVFDGERIYMDSYNATDQLNTMKYKNRSVNHSGFYNRDLKNFLVGTGDNAYEMGREMDDITIGRDYDLQFENMYWCGAESINSDIYSQELGFIAPLYIRKKLPNYFVIFKVDGAANTNMNDFNSDSEPDDTTFDFNEDVLKKSSIIKTFDLREGTVMGDYLRRYVGQDGFKYDQSVYINMSSQEAWFYGIDKSTGLLCKKVDKFNKSVLNMDTTITYSDKWFTEGYMRNGLIYPYIINIEFLFDDDETPLYEFSRYFGIYCNDIDLYTTNVVASNGSTLIVTDSHNVDGCFPYIKDKKNNLFFIKSTGQNTLTLGNSVDGNFDISEMTGYEPTSISATCFRADSSGCASYAFSVNKKFEQGEGFSIIFDDKTFRFVGDYSKNISKGGYEDYVFSLNGDIYDVARAICGAVNSTKGKPVFRAVSDSNDVVIQSLYPGEEYNHRLSIVFDDELLYNRKVIASSKNSMFYGGSSNSGDTFKIYSEDADVFVVGRNVRTTNGSVAKIEYVSPYIDENNHLDSRYLEVIISNGKYVQMSNIHSIELLDSYAPSVGVLSMFPVKDFDFNIHESLYGDDTDFKNQCVGLKGVLYNRCEDDDSKIGVLTKDECITLKWDDGVDYEYVRYKSGDLTVFVMNDESEEEKLDLCAWQCINSPIRNIVYIERDDYEDLNDGDTPNVFIYYYENYNYIHKKKQFTYKDRAFSPSDIEIKEFTTDTVPNRMSDEEGRHIDNEYDYYVESYLPELCTVSKTSPYICKWAYYDNQKDGCGNPYRLNVSKIFGQNNLSPNVNAYKGSIENYTHHLPYYLNISEDNLISKTEVFDSEKKSIGGYIDLFSNTEVDYFDKIFNRKVNNKEGISSQLYSRYDFGDASTYPSCLFKGVKFVLTPIENGSDTPSSKYNGYKFSMMYVPSSSGMFDDKIVFVKNDKFKFIVGLIRFDIKVPENYLNDNIDTTLSESFSSAIAYAGCLDMLPKPSSEDMEGERRIKVHFDDCWDALESYASRELIINNSGLVDLIKSSYYINTRDNDTIIKLGIKPVGTSIPIDMRVSHVKRNDIQIQDKIIISNFSNINSKYLTSNVPCQMTFWILDKSTSLANESKLYEDYYSDFNRISAYGISHNINEKNNVMYSSGDFRINIEAPASIEAFDVLMSIPVEVSKRAYHQIGSVKISPKNINNMRTIQLNRYSGYYNPICNDILFFKDYDGSPYSNTGFDLSIDGFGYIKDVYFHKINKEYANTILSLTPYYPALNQYAIDKRDYNIFSSSWDKDYFTTQLDLNSYRREENVCGMMNELCMFGSKYLHLPEEIRIDTLNGSTEWDDDYYKGSKSIEKEMMLKEVGTSTVNFYLFLHKRIVRYFIEETQMRETFAKYLNPKYSFGDLTTLDDDIEEYVEKNILKLYALDDITIWVKSKKMGVNDRVIENDYESALGMSNIYRQKAGFDAQKGVSIQKVTTDSFDRKLVYNMKSGYMETFGFSFRIKKI